jgi:hypothetical protein
MIPSARLDRTRTPTVAPPSNVRDQDDSLLLERQKQLAAVGEVQTR